MHTADNFLEDQLAQRNAAGTLRSLSNQQLPVDFCSNDYLGFARSADLQYLVKQQTENIVCNGATGSRLLSGNSKFIEDTERKIAEFHQAPAGLIFNSGYDANIGLLSSVAKRGDTIITDELIHASLIDGARLSHAERLRFRHNDITDLEQKLSKAKGNIYVVIETIYSMDGDIAPLREISDLCQRYQANLIADEAHATGVLGKSGEGLVQQLQLQDVVFARIVTFGKALGCHGAIVLGSKLLHNFLINFCRSFIYTTAAPLHSIACINAAYQLLNESHVNQLQRKIELYDTLISHNFPNHQHVQSAVKTIIIGGNAETREAARRLQANGMDVRAILSPTVAAGTERLRICLHTFNTDNEIHQLVSNLQNIINGR